MLSIKRTSITVFYRGLVSISVCSSYSYVAAAATYRRVLIRRPQVEVGETQVGGYHSTDFRKTINLIKKGLKDVQLTC